MKAPKCRLCEKEHWGVCGGSKEREEKAEKLIALAKTFPRPTIMEDSPISVLKRVTVEKLGVCPHCGKLLSMKPDGKFNKTKYQREYMRKRREPVDEVEVEFTNDVKYPEEVRSESIEVLLKREMAKGKVYGHIV